MVSVSRSYYLFIALLAAMSVIIPAGCSDAARPDNLEPRIETFEATDITRTEAVISARVHQRGPVALTHVSFHYGETGNISHAVTADDPGAQNFTCRLTGLRPGTSYSWFVEGGTPTATLRSGTITFKTELNDRPVVSPLVALSTGPVGVIVSFDIVDDGGEPILEAGCEITDNRALRTTRTYLPADCLNEGSHRMSIGGLNLETSYTITPFASNSSGETKGLSLDYTTRNSIVLKEPGSLPDLFDGSPYVDIAQLTVAGKMNGDDFRFLRGLLGAPVPQGVTTPGSSVTSVDLSDVEITEGGAPYDGKRYTVADELSTGLLADCVRLRHIRLPASAKILARDALARCSALENMTVPADVASVLPSEGCTALQAIDVSAANQNYTSIDGVLFNGDATAILWFPLGKTGEYVLPSTITSIGEGAFTGTSITSLQVPGSVTGISRGAFAGSSLVIISLPDNITNIAEGLFQNCSALTAVHLGNRTEFIGNYAFDGTNLKDLFITAPVPPYASKSAFFNRIQSITENGTLYVPVGCKAIYRNHLQWGQFSKIEEY